MASSDCQGFPSLCSNCCAAGNVVEMRTTKLKFRSNKFHLNSNKKTDVSILMNLIRHIFPSFKQWRKYVE